MLRYQFGLEIRPSGTQKIDKEMMDATDEIRRIADICRLPVENRSSDERHSITASESRLNFVQKYRIPFEITPEIAETICIKTMKIAMQFTDTPKLTEENWSSSKQILEINQHIQKYRGQDYRQRIQPAFKVPTTFQSKITAFKLGSGKRTVIANLQYLQGIKFSQEG